MKLRQPTEPEAQMDMTPMIDCVFQLLIFFMVAASMTKMDQMQEIRLPIAPKAAIPEKEQLQGRGVINIAPLGTAAGGGTVTESKPFMIGGQLTDERGLMKILEEKTKDTPDFKVYMRVDKDAEFRTVKRAIRACANAGVYDIIFGTFQSKAAGGES